MIVLNKNFNNNYMRRAFERMIFSYTNSKKQYDNNVYRDCSVDFSTKSTVNVWEHFICTSRFIDIIDKIYDGTLNGEIVYPADNTGMWNFRPIEGTTKLELPAWAYTITCLFTDDLVAHKGFLKILVSSDIITQDDMDYVLSTVSILKNLDVTTVITTNDNDNVYTLNYNLPIELNKRYDNSLNTLNEELYLLCVPMEVWAYNDESTNEYKYVYKTFYSKVHDKNFILPTYLAFSVGESGSGKDIEFDHIDNIDYIDTLEIKYTLPKSFS